MFWKKKKNPPVEIEEAEEKAINYGSAQWPVINTSTSPSARRFMMKKSKEFEEVVKKYSDYWVKQ